jgi:hypothetical protein
MELVTLVSSLPTPYEHKHTQTHLQFLPEDERGLSSQLNKNRVNAALLVQLYSYGWTYKLSLRASTTVGGR